MFVFGLCFSSPARADKRIALVIGNGAYKNAPRLPNPKNDAADVAAALKRSGFETIVGLDLDKAGMDDATIRFARSAREADVAIFYYSGHAMQFSGVNYLMPVDAKLSDEADLRRMTRVDDVVNDVQQAKNLRIVVLDSCRDNPLAEELKRSIGRTRGVAVSRGLAKIDSPQGMIVAYSTQAGRTAEDGKGRNSPYTTAFLKHIEASAEIGTVFRRVSADVYEGTNRTQLPELSLSLIGEFYLRGQPAASSPVAVPPPATATPSPSSEANNAWGEVKNSSNPVVLEAFIRRFGDSFYGDLARARLDELKKGQTAVVAPPVTPVVPSAAPPAPATPAPQLSPPSSVVGNGAVLVAQYGDWGVYSAAPNGKKVCFALTRIAKSSANQRNQTKDVSYIFISNRPADGVKNEFSMITDRNFSSDSDAVVEIGGTSYAMYAKNKQVWVRGLADESRLIDAMRHNATVSFKGGTVGGARPTDDFSMKGFSDALERAAQECK